MYALPVPAPATQSRVAVVELDAGRGVASDTRHEDRARSGAQVAPVDGAVGDRADVERRCRCRSRFPRAGTPRKLDHVREERRAGRSSPSKRPQQPAAPRRVRTRETSDKPPLCCWSGCFWRVRDPERTGSCPGALAPRLQGPLHVAVGLAFREVTPLVALLLASRERELHLRPAVLEVEPRRDEGQTPLRHLARQRGELLLVEEQLAVAIRVVVRDVPLVVDGNVGADEPRLSVPEIGIGLLRGTRVRRAATSPRCRSAQGRPRRARGGGSRAGHDGCRR